MRELPVYVEAAGDEAPDAYFRKGVVSTPLRLARETPEAQIDPRGASIMATASRLAATLPDAAMHAKIGRLAEAAEAVSRAGVAHAPGDASILPADPRDAAALEAVLARDAPALEVVLARDAAALAALARRGCGAGESEGAAMSAARKKRGALRPRRRTAAARPANPRSMRGRSSLGRSSSAATPSPRAMPPTESWRNFRR